MTKDNLTVSEFLSKYFTNCMDIKVEVNTSTVPLAFKFVEIFSGTIGQFFKNNYNQYYNIKNFSFILSNENVRIRILP